MPENTENGFDWTRIVKPAATAASLVPALWLKGQRKKDWLRGVGAFWGGVEQKKQAREQAEQRDALAEYYKERAKSLESERKAEEAKAKLTAYRKNRPSGVGRIGTPSMIGQTQIGGDVTLSPERLNWIRSQMGGGARPAPPTVRAGEKPPPASMGFPGFGVEQRAWGQAPAAPPTGQRLKPSPAPTAGEMRPELFETGAPMTGQERGQFLGAVGTTAGGMLRPDLFGKPPTAPTPKEKSWIDSSGRKVQKTDVEYQRAVDVGEVLTDNVPGYTQAVNAYYEALEGADDKKKRRLAKQLGYEDPKSLEALLGKSSYMRKMAIDQAIRDYGGQSEYSELVADAQRRLRAGEITQEKYNAYIQHLQSMIR